MNKPVATQRLREDAQIRSNHCGMAIHATNSTVDLATMVLYRAEKDHGYRREFTHRHKQCVQPAATSTLAYRSARTTQTTIKRGAIFSSRWSKWTATGHDKELALPSKTQLETFKLAPIIALATTDIPRGDSLHRELSLGT